MKTRYELLLPLGKPDPALARGKLATHLQVEVYYTLGGAMFGGGPTRRGIYVSASPIEIQREGGAEMRGYLLFSGTKLLLEETTRKNDRRLAQLAEVALAEVRDKKGKPWELVQHVLQKNGLALAEEQGAVPAAVEGAAAAEPGAAEPAQCESCQAHAAFPEIVHLAVGDGAEAGGGSGASCASADRSERAEDEELPLAVSTAWLLSFLAGMKFPEAGGAHDAVKRALLAGEHRR